MPEPQAIGEFIWQLMPEGPEKYQAYLCSREWAVKRRAVLERCGEVCERCHVNPVSAVHHLTYERKFAERIEDLAGWCQGCHAFTHGKSDNDPLGVELIRRQNPAYMFSTETAAFRSHGALVKCPYPGCHSENCHQGEPVLGEEPWKSDGTSMFGNQGNIVIPMSCEGGHAWELCLRGHKGDLEMFLRNLHEEYQEYA